MEISSIKIQRLDGENTRLKAVATVIFDNCIVVRDVKIIVATENVFIAMPAIKLKTGEFKDICHPLTIEFRDYMQRNVIDVFNSGESERTFENEFTEPKIDVKIKPVLDNDVILGVCSMAIDDKFVIHNIKIVKVGEKGITVIFPYRKTPTDETIYVCELINNKEKYENQIIDAYLKMVESNSSNSSNNGEQNNNKDENNDAPGWDAITAEAERVYPTQKNPKHYGTFIKYRFGGKDPIDGFSVYDGGDYWHFVTYGISELYEKETDNKEISGYGMEFTFKLKKDNYENEEAEIKNICGILQSLARITFSKGEIFNEYEYLYSGQTDGIDANKKSNLTGFITIPDKDFKPIDTPNGKVKFVEFIGVTDDELKAIMDKRIKAKELYEMLGSDITDYHRKSVFENTGDKVDINKPVENPELKWLIEKYSNAQDDRKNEVIEIILQKIAEEAKLLSIAIFSQKPISKDNGTSTIEAGTRIGFPTVTYKDGKYRYFPAYTDWTELRKNPSIDKEPSTMVFGFDDYATFVIDQSDDDGLVINPYSEHPFFLSRKQMEHIRNVKNNNTNVRNNMSKEQVNEYKTIKNERIGFEIKIPTNWKDMSIEKLSQVEDLEQLAFVLVSENGIEMMIGIVELGNSTFESVCSGKIEKIKESGASILSQNIIEHGGTQIRNLLMIKSDGTYLCQNFFDKNGYLCDVHWMVREGSNLDSVINSEKMRVMYSLKKTDNENITQKHSETSEKSSELKAIPFEVEGCPRFVFYFPENLGSVEKTYSNVFEIRKDKVQKVRVMVSKCPSANAFESDTKKWIEKNKIDGKMEEVTHRNEKINDIIIEVYELKYSEHPEWAHKIYKIGFVNGCRVTISGWLVKGREEIINQAFEKLESEQERKQDNNVDVQQAMVDFVRMTNYKLHAEQLNFPILDGFIRESTDNNPQLIFAASTDGFVEQLVSDGSIGENEFEQRIELCKQNVKKFKQDRNIEGDMYYFKDYFNGTFQFKIYVEDTIIISNNEKRVIRAFNAYFVEPKMHDFYQMTLSAGPFIMPTEILKVGVIDIENDAVTANLDRMMKTILDNLKYRGKMNDFVVLYSNKINNIEEVINIDKYQASYYKQTPNGIEDEIDIEDSKFIEQMIICNVYLPLKDKLFECYKHNEKPNEKEADSLEVLYIKDKDDIALYCSNSEKQTDKSIVDSFVNNLKNTMKFYQNKNK